MSIVPGTRRRAGEVEHEPRGDGLTVERLLGREALLEARAGLAAQPELQRRRVDVGRVPVRRLHEDAGRVGLDLGAVSAHDTGDRRRPGGVGDEADLAVDGARLVVERDDLLAVGGAAHDEATALDAVQIEGVQRLAGQQHDVVRDVDDVVDRALAAGHQARLQPRRRRADRHVREGARGEARAEVGRFDGDLDRDRHAVVCLVGRARVVGPRRRRKLRARRRVRLARDRHRPRGSRAGWA